MAKKRCKRGTGTDREMVRKRDRVRGINVKQVLYIIVLYSLSLKLFEREIERQTMREND